MVVLDLPHEVKAVLELFYL